MVMEGNLIPEMKTKWNEWLGLYGVLEPRVAAVVSSRHSRTMCTSCDYIQRIVALTSVIGNSSRRNCINGQSKKPRTDTGSGTLNRTAPDQAWGSGVVGSERQTCTLNMYKYNIYNYTSSPLILETRRSPRRSHPTSRYFGIIHRSHKSSRRYCRSSHSIRSKDESRLCPSGRPSNMASF